MMDATTLIRQLQITLITEESHPLVDWFNGYWNRLQSIQTNVFCIDNTEIIYYLAIGKRKCPVFYYNPQGGIIYYDYELYAKFFYQGSHSPIVCAKDFDFISIAKLDKITALLLSSIFNDDIDAQQIHLEHVSEIITSLEKFNINNN